MSDASVKITHQVPQEVQRVLDAMTEENWHQGGMTDEAGHMCFFGQAYTLAGMKFTRPVSELTWGEDLQNRCYDAHGMYAGTMNDTSTSLSDFKQKIVDLYRVEKP